jgi:TatD DNase family protein
MRLSLPVPTGTEDNMMSLVDAHAHLGQIRATGGSFMDAPNVFNTGANPPTQAINVVCNPWTMAKELAWPCPGNIRRVVGVHPRAAASCPPSWRLRQYLERDGVVGIGECGLDRSPTPHQYRALRIQLQLATSMHLPVQLHLRDNEGTALAFVRRYLHPGSLVHLHCYNGRWADYVEWAQCFHQVYVGFTTMLGEPRGAPMREIASRIPLERILTESDAPHFGPVDQVVELLAGIRGEPAGAIARCSADNAQYLYFE